MDAYLPDLSRGWLPAFVLLVGITAITNALQCYKDVAYLQRVYNPPSPTHNLSPKNSDPRAAANPSSPVTDLSARTFGTWNMAVGIVRLYAAYNLFEKSWYQMSLLTNLIGLVHFGLEAFVYKTARPSGPFLAPTSVATIGAVWHILQYDNYVG